MEASAYLFSFLVSFFIVLIFRQIDKKQSNLALVKRFVDTNIKKFQKDINEKKEELDKAALDMEMVLQKGQALSKYVSEHMKNIDQKMGDMEKAEQVLDALRNEMKMLKENVGSVTSEMDFLRKESAQVKATRVDYNKLAKDFKDVSKKADDMEKAMQDDLERKKDLLDKKMQENIKKFEQYLKVSLDQINKENKQKIDLAVGQYNQSCKMWLDEKKKEVEVVGETLSRTNRELEKVKSDSLQEIEKEIKSKLGELDKLYTLNKTRIEKQGEKMMIFRDQIYNDFNQKFREFSNETATILTKARNDVQRMDDTVKTMSGEFKHDMQIQVKDISERIAEFEEPLKKIDKIASDNEEKINREINLRIKEIENNLKTRYESINNQVKSGDLQVKDFLKKFQDKITSQVQETYAEIDIYKSKVKEELGGFRNVMDKEKEQILTSIEKSLVSLENHKEKLKKDFEMSFIENQKGILDHEIQNLKNSIEESERTTHNRIKDRVEELEKLFYQKDDEINRMMNSRKEELFSKLNEYQVLVESNMQKGDERVKSFISEFHENLKNAQVNNDEKMLVYLKEAKSKIDTLYGDVDAIQFKFDNVLKKQKTQLQGMVDDIKDKMNSQFGAIEANFKDKEKKMLGSLQDKSDILSKRSGEIEEMLSNIKGTLYKEIGKNTEDIKLELMKIEKEFENQVRMSISSLDEEMVGIRDEIGRLRDKGELTQKNLIKDLEGKIKVFEGDFKSNMDGLEKALLNKKNNLENAFEMKWKELGMKLDDFEKNIFHLEMQNKGLLKETTESVKQEIVEFENKLNAFKADRKLDKFLEELGNFENVMRKVRKEKDNLSEVEKNYLKLKKDSEDILNQLGKFEAKKGEIININDRMNDIVAKSREAEERMHQLNRNAAALTQVEGKINRIQALYEELQTKAEVVEAKELKIKDIVQMVEANDQFAQELREEGQKVKKQVDDIFKKSGIINNHIQDLQARLEEVRKGEEKIDEVLSRFSEIEILSMDLEERLKQMENATYKLDAAEARVKNLMNIVDSPETLQKAKKAKVLSTAGSLTKKSAPIAVAPGFSTHMTTVGGTMNEAGYNAENVIKNINPSKRDSIIRFKNSGHKPEVIANILEMSPDDVEAVIKYYAAK